MSLETLSSDSRYQRDGSSEKRCDVVVVVDMNESRCYTDSPVLVEHQAFNRNGKALRYDYHKD